MLCSVVQPKLDIADQRYDSAANAEGDADAHLMRYRLRSQDSDVTERRGVLHLVQGWIQRLQPTKVCCRTNADSWKHTDFGFGRVSSCRQNSPAAESHWVEFGVGTGSLDRSPWSWRHISKNCFQMITRNIRRPLTPECGSKRTPAPGWVELLYIN
jgi:hypothetical protein